jgi:hypothetical protein
MQPIFSNQDDRKRESSSWIHFDVMAKALKAQSKEAWQAQVALARERLKRLETQRDGLQTQPQIGAHRQRHHELVSRMFSTAIGFFRWNGNGRRDALYCSFIQLELHYPAQQIVVFT